MRRSTVLSIHLQLVFPVACIINVATEKDYKWRYETQHNGTQLNDIGHNDIQSNDTPHSWIQHNYTRHNYIMHDRTQHNYIHFNKLSITTYSMTTFAILQLA